ncbi:MAG: ATP-binding protein [Acidobacteriota bacterium]
MIVLGLLAVVLGLLTAALYMHAKTAVPTGGAMELGERLLAFARDSCQAGLDVSSYESLARAHLKKTCRADAVVWFTRTSTEHVNVSVDRLLGGIEEPSFEYHLNLFSALMALGGPLASDGARTFRLRADDLEPVEVDGWSDRGNPLRLVAERGRYSALLVLPMPPNRMAVCYRKNAPFTPLQVLSAGLIAEMATLSIAHGSVDEASARNAFKASALMSIGQNINSHLSLDRVLSLIVGYVGPMLGADGAFLFLAEEPGQMELAAGWWKEHVFSTDDLRPIAVYCSQHGATVTFPTKTIEEAPEIPGVAVPIVAYDRVTEHPRSIGVLLCVRRSGERRFSEEDTDFLVSFADQAAIAVANAELYENLRRANERLRDLDRGKNEFLEIVAHDIQSPLNALVGLVDMLLVDERERRLSPEVREQTLIHLIARAEGVSRAAGESLSVAQIESGELSIRPEPVRIAEALDDFDVKPPASCTLLLDVPSDIPLLMIDRFRIRQVMNNLLDNAYKYSPEGGKVVLRARWNAEPEPLLTISVEDHGIGFESDQKRYLFKKFGRLDAKRTRSIPGSGMGLYICRRIVEAHGGRISAESRGPGLGARFTIELPVASAPETATQEATADR